MREENKMQDGNAEHLNQKNGEKYIVIQVVLTERLFGSGSGKASLEILQREMNRQAELGYRLHSFSTTASGNKGIFGGDKIQATMVFERIDYTP